MITYITTGGTCARNITISIENGILQDVVFLGGCDGNLQGIVRLVRGMKVEEVIKRLKGIKCGDMETSCPDQLARALEEYVRSADMA